MAKIDLIDEISNVNIRCNGNNSCVGGVFIVDTPLLRGNTDNGALLDGFDRIDIQCNGISSCQDSIISIIAVKSFQLDCIESKSCYNASISMATLGNQMGAGILTVNCNGSSSCEIAIISGISLETVNINCIDGGQTCWGAQVC